MSTRSHMEMARQALLTLDVIRNIAQFEPGIYKDLQVLVNLKAPKLGHYDIQPSFDALDNHLAPWYSEFGIERLTILFSSLPHIQRVLLMHATYYGRLDILEFVQSYNNGVVDCQNYLVDLAAWAGQTAIVEYLLSIGHPGYTSHAMFLAAKYGHLEVIKTLHAADLPGTVFDMNIAAANGHLDVVKLLHENRVDGCSTKAMDYAAANGHLETVKWLHENRTEGCTKEAMNLAAKNGHLEVVKFLHYNRTEGCTSRAMSGAGISGHLDVLEFLHSKRTEGCDAYDMCAAAFRGHLHVVKWYHANAGNICRMLGDPIDSAAAGGHLEIVEFLMSAGNYKFSSKAIDKSIPYPEIFKRLIANRPHHARIMAPQLVKAGNLDLLCFVSNNSMVKESLRANAQQHLEAAVKMGRLDILEWFVQFGTKECSAGALNEALKNGHEEVIIFLLDKNLVPLSFKKKMINTAAKKGALRVIQYLHAQSTACRDRSADTNAKATYLDQIELCTTDAMNWAASKGFLDIVIFLHFNRSEGCTSHAMNWAAGNGHKDIVEFLHAHRTEGCSDSALQYAADNGHSDIVYFLYANRKDMCTHYTLDEVASRGHLKVLKFLDANTISTCNLKALEGAVHNGHLEVAQWLVTYRGLKPTQEMAVEASRAGRFGVARWLHEEYGFVIERRMLLMIAYAGDLDAMRYVIHHVNLSVHDFAYAAEGALESCQLDAFKILLQYFHPGHRAPIPSRGSALVTFHYYLMLMSPEERDKYSSDELRVYQKCQ